MYFIVFLRFKMISLKIFIEFGLSCTRDRNSVREVRRTGEIDFNIRIKLILSKKKSRIYPDISNYDIISSRSSEKACFKVP